ncbi:MAG TPA: class I SAM-dependent methyltransferase, partial [bacterium]|nr:class I SAM-dependent methyltransferase [bacterium]
LRVFAEMNAAVSFRGRSVLELGCGTGRLSYLALRNGAERAVLMDSSPRAVAIAESLFRGVSNVEIRRADFTTLRPEKRFDIVFSSGVVEHFPDGEIEAIVDLHGRWSRGSVVIVVPAGPHYNNVRMKRAAARRRFGWQRPLTRARMKKLFAGAGIAVSVNRRFYTFYAVPRLHRCRLLDRWAKPIEGLAGGLLVTAGTAQPDRTS